MYIEGGVAWITTGINSPGNKCDCIVLNGDLIETSIRKRLPEPDHLTTKSMLASTTVPLPSGSSFFVDNLVELRDDLIGVYRASNPEQICFK